MSAHRDGNLLNAAADELQSLLLHPVEQTRTHYVSPAQPEATA